MIRSRSITLAIAALLLVSHNAYSQDATQCTRVNTSATPSYDFTEELSRWGSKSSYSLAVPMPVVRSITVNTLPIFDESNGRENNFLFRWANRIHFTTRPKVITDQLLFTVGEAVDEHLLAESERILRSRQYVGDAAIRVLQECGKAVDLEVVSREVWTLTPDVSFKSTGGHNSSSIGIRDSNILGTGQLLDLKYKHDPERSSWGLVYKNPNIGSDHEYFNGELDRNSDGHHSVLELAQPFYSLDDKHAWQVRVESTSEILNQYTFGTRVSSLVHDLKSADVSYGISNGLINGRVNRFSAGFYTSEQSWQPEQLWPVPVAYHSALQLNYPYFQYDYIEDNFVTGFNIGQIMRTEDLQLGRHLRSRIGYASGAGGNLIVQGDYGDTLLYEVGRLMQVSASWDGRWNRTLSRFEDTVMKASLEYQQELSERRTLDLSLVGNHVINLHDGTQLIVGGSNGLRGYDTHFLNGTGSVQFTAEERYFTDYHWLQLLRVGFAAFYDVGRVFGNADPLAQRIYQDVGFGLRLAPSRSESGQVVHIDLAFPLRTDAPGVKGRQLVVEVKTAF